VPDPDDGSAATVVLVEDEPAIADAVAARLRADGHRVEVARDGPAGVALCRAVAPDLVVLDLMLPGLDGYEVCRQVQAARPVLVLMLTARDEEADVVVGLRMGADDYLTKPFSMRELSARVAALLRRSPRPAPGPAPLRLGDVALDPAARRVQRGDQQVHLTPTEFDLLVRLAEQPARSSAASSCWPTSGAGGRRQHHPHRRHARRLTASQARRRRGAHRARRRLRGRLVRRGGLLARVGSIKTKLGLVVAAPPRSACSARSTACSPASGCAGRCCSRWRWPCSSCSCWPAG
jgi:DNA-binding response OmpR family regulator